MVDAPSPSPYGDFEDDTEIHKRTSQSDKRPYDDDIVMEEVDDNDEIYDMQDEKTKARKARRADGLSGAST